MEETVNTGGIKELLLKVFKDDETLFQDLENHSPHDIPGLLRRVEVLYKQYSSRKYQLTETEIQVLVSRLLQLSLSSADSTKLARAIEKIIRLHEADCKELIFKHYQDNLKEHLSCMQPNTKILAKVSILFEQNSMVQEVLRQNLGHVTDWTSTIIGSLVRIPPADLSPTQAQSLTAVVKICLQMFQVCPQELGSMSWDAGHLSLDNNPVPIPQIVEALVHILATQGYTSECVLLCGTAVAIILNTNKDNNSTWLASEHILAHTLGIHGSSFSYEDLLKVEDNQTFRLKLIKALPQVPSYFLGPVALIRAIVACANAPLLLTHFTNQTAYHQLYDYILTLCKGDITLHFHSFNALVLWYTRLNRFISLEESRPLKDLLPGILESSLQLVIVNWDSPVEDVPEAVVSVFTQMMTTWTLVREQVPSLPDRVLDLVTSTQWYVKGKYRILAVLLKYIDTDQMLQSCPGIQDQLVQCLTTNHLAPASTAVYKTILQQTKGDLASKTETWRLRWINTVLAGLISTNSLLCYNMSLQWLPVTTKVLPSCATLLKDHIYEKMMGPDAASVCRSRWLHAWITVTRSIRNCTGAVTLSDGLVRESLYCADEGVRAEALGLVCNTLKKSESITEVEARLLKETITFNVKLDSAPFRQTLGSNIRRLLVRLRDTCVLMLKDVQTNKEKLDCSIEFVDWLHVYCVDCLLPGACYQRRKGALDLMHVLYGTLIYLPNSQHKKGFTPESTKSLVQYAQSTRSWMFQSRDTTHSLILTLLDSSEEIQDSVFQLLTGYGSDSFTDADDKLCCLLLQEALRLCHSPKGREGQSGAALCKLIFQKYVIGQKMALQFRFCNESHNFIIKQRCDGNDSPIHYLRDLLSEIERCLRESDTNVVQASTQYPIHGLVSALYQCLTETVSLWTVVDDDLLTLVADLVTLCRSLIDKMLRIMSNVADQEACPSFSEISVALETLLQEFQSDYTETTTQSPEYQYMLSWCWNNIKESCICLGESTMTLVTQRASLPVTVYTNMCSSFVSVLTKCRHKGVIEGTRTAFIHFCSAMFNSSEEQLIKIPVDTLKQVLIALKSSALVSSVTRRSAGLPIIIQAVLISEKKVHKSSLLTQAVSDLFETCQLPLEEGPGLQDLPQVQALNILDQLYSDAALTASLMGHISRAILLVIDMFGSPSWAIRNAATPLFKTLMSRVFGQKKNNDGDLCSSVTFQELMSHYPELPPFLLGLLKQAASRDIREISQLHPGLFPLLTLLSFLKPTPTQDDSLKSIQQEFSDLLQLFVASPVYQLRHLVAPALVAMVNLADMPSAAEDSFNRMSKCKVNELHGELLIVNRLVDFIDSPVDLSALWSRLLDTCEHLLSCDLWMVSAQCVHILHKALLKHGSLSVPQHLLQTVMDLCCKKYKQGSIGGGVFSEKAVSLLFSTYLRTKESVAGLCQHLLTSVNEDTRRVCLESLSDWLLDQSADTAGKNSDAILNILLDHARKEISIPNLSFTFDLVTRLYLDTKVKPTDDLDVILDWFSDNAQILEQHVSLGAKSLPVQAICIKKIMNSEVSLCTKRTKVSKWCCQLYDLSRRTNETQRMSVAQTLLVAGQPILDHVTQARDNDMEQCVVSLVSACLTLIQDEDTNIRSEACKFVSQLHWESRTIKYPSIHSNVCYEVFLSYISSCLHWSAACVHLLTSILYTPGEMTSVLRVKDTARFQQLFDQDDNSFFAERLYNSLSVHTALKSICRSCLAEDKLTSIQCLKELSAGIREDLNILSQHLNTIDQGNIINKYCDNTILAVLCGLLLLADCVAMVTEDEERVLINSQIDHILQKNVLPPPLQRQLSSMHGL